MNTKQKIARWFYILSAIWVIFWILDLVVFVPLVPNSFTQTLREIFTDPVAFSISWTFVTAPLQLYIIFLGLYNLVGFIKKHNMVSGRVG